jgi:hypothetical protein
MVVGDPGSGKSFALATLPKPVLVADVMGGVHSIPPPPGREIDGFLYTKDGIDVAYPKTWQDLLTFVTVSWRKEPSEEAKKFGGYYKSVVIDQLSECNFHLILNEVATEDREVVSVRQWGIIGKKVKLLARKLKDLTDAKRFPQGPVVVLCTLRKDKDDVVGDSGPSEIDKEGWIMAGRVGPLLSGQCFEDVPSIPDVILQMRVVTTRDPNNPKRVTKRRMFQTDTDGVYMARSRFAGLNKMEPPNFIKLFEKIDAERRKSGQLAGGAKEDTGAAKDGGGGAGKPRA